MKTREIFNSWLPRFLKVGAITLYPFIFYAGKKRGVKASLRAHEMQHISDIQELGFFRFYTAYLIYYVAGLVRFGSHARAYWSNPFEIRAREVEFMGVYSLPSKNLSK